jgi:hypothetical protein
VCYLMITASLSPYAELSCSCPRTASYIRRKVTRVCRNERTNYRARCSRPTYHSALLEVGACHRMRQEAVDCSSAIELI